MLEETTHGIPQPGTARENAQHLANKALADQNRMLEAEVARLTKERDAALREVAELRAMLDRAESQRQRLQREVDARG